MERSSRAGDRKRKEAPYTEMSHDNDRKKLSFYGTIT